MEQSILKLSEFLDIVKSQFDEIIGYHSYVIQAEVKSIKQNRQFYYMELVEIEGGKIVDVAKANIFNPSVMTSFLREVNIYNIQELVGKTLLLTVRPTFHKTYNFSVNVMHINTDFFVGGLEKKKKETIKELKDRGIFYNNKSRDIGTPTFNIAVITGDKSEGFRDFETILKESGYKYNLTVFKSLVHGEKASKQVLEQLNKISLVRDKYSFNLVAIIRGGGGSDGINWTNDFDLCKTVCEFEIPVMTAVGHTVDQSILDMVSCFECKTPSEASKILIDLYDEIQSNLDSDYEYINNCILDFRDKYSQELKFISKNLPLQISRKIRGYKQKLESFNIDKKLKYNIKYLHNSLEYLYANIKSNNPDKILDKGYNLIFDNKGKVIKEYDVGNRYLMKSKNHEYIIEVLEKK